MFIREFLIAVNKSALQYRPGNDPLEGLRSISLMIIQEVKQLSSKRNVPIDHIINVIEEVKITASNSSTEVGDERVNTISYMTEATS